MFSHQRFVERFLHAPPKIDMTDARGLLQEAAVIATSPITAPAPADHAATQLTAPSGSAPNFPLDSSSTNPFYVNSHFSPTMIIILVILLSAFLFMALFAVYVRRCTSDEGLSWRGNSRRMSRRDDSNNMGCGVDPLLVESYPIVSYAVAKKKGCYECPVCLSEFEGGDELKQLPKCKHVFHPGCIGLWLESHTTCPLCRRSLVNSDRWSMSFRWGGSSRGSSLSTRHNGQESSRSRRSGETASARLGRAGSSTGWHGRNEDASSRGCVQHETGLRVIDASSSSELESQGLPTSNSLAASDRLSEGVRRGLPASPLASEGVPPGRTESVLSNLWPHGIQAACVSSDLMPHEIQECTVSTELMMPRGYQSSEVAGRGQHGSRESSELATNAASELAKGEGKKPRLQGRRKLSRSNSTGHSLRRRAVLQTAGCILPFSLHRSRSVGVDGLDEEEGMVGPACATSEHSLVSGSGCTSHIPRQPCHDSTSASPPSEK